MYVALPVLVFALLVAPATRLLALGLRTRRAPEIWGGLFFTGLALGIPLRVLGHSLAASQPEQAALCNTLGHICFAGGAAAMAVFTWRVFRRDRPWARALCAGVVLAIVGTTIAVVVSDRVNDERSVAMLATNAARLLPMTWAFAESLRYWRTMRRREALGLADPVVVDRFRLWAIWTAALSVLPAMTLSLRLLGQIPWIAALAMEQDLAQSPIVLVLVRAVFLASLPIGALALSFSFLPPERYVRWVRARSADRSAVPIAPV